MCRAATCSSGTTGRQNSPMYSECSCWRSSARRRPRGRRDEPGGVVQGRAADRGERRDPAAQPRVGRLGGDRVPQLHRAPVVADQVHRAPSGEHRVEHRDQVVDEALGAVAGRRPGASEAPAPRTSYVTTCQSLEGQPRDQRRPRCPAGRGSRAPAPRWAVRGPPGCARGPRGDVAGADARAAWGRRHVTKGTEPVVVVDPRHGANVSRDPPGAEVCPVSGRNPEEDGHTPWT